MDISIFGLGYVGAVSLACLARDGHRVVGVDVDQAKLDLIASGHTPVVEEGMVELMAAAVASGRVAVTRDERDALMRSEISLICVGTPSAPNGSQDQTAMLRLAKDLGAALREKSASHVFVFRSTLVPGTVEDILRKHGVRYTIEWYLSGEPFYTPPGLLSDAVAEAVAQVTGARPRLSTGGGTSDGRFIAPLGAEVVELGVVNASIHKVNECVRAADVEALERMYLNVLRKLLT